jgi:glucosamine--fructose-6-phosphate aminotransferase (isomerizing)
MTQSHLLTEIRAQPGILRDLIDAERANIATIARAVTARNPRFVLLAARGSSDNAARYGQYLFGAANRLPVALATPSLYTLYGQPPHIPDALVIAISQSGQSPDIVSVIETGRAQGALTLALTNDPGSPVARAAEHVIHLHAGAEQAVAATKTYTTSLLAIAMLSAALNDDTARAAQIDRVPAWVDAVVSDAGSTIDASLRYTFMDACVVLSRGYNYATAYEVALKLKELTYVLAEPYSSADFQHGPVALVEQGFPVLAVVPQGPLIGELMTFIADLKMRGADLTIISGDDAALRTAQTPLPVPAGIPEWLSPIVAVVRGQLFALGLTLARGYDPDHPRGIRKITLTE